jgi:hypothetical protein
MIANGRMDMTYSNCAATLRRSARISSLVPYYHILQYWLGDAQECFYQSSLDLLVLVPDAMLTQCQRSVDAVLTLCRHSVDIELTLGCVTLAMCCSNIVFNSSVGVSVAMS